MNACILLELFYMARFVDVFLNHESFVTMNTTSYTSTLTMMSDERSSVM